MKLVLAALELKSLSGDSEELEADLFATLKKLEFDARRTALALENRLSLPCVRSYLLQSSISLLLSAAGAWVADPYILPEVFD